MEVDHPMVLSAPSQTQPHRPVATIVCCECGAPIDGTTAVDALCADCVKLTHDISAGIQRDALLQFCRDCDRWLSPPSQWVVAAPESRELLALCLKKLRGLAKSRIVDASFIWTEPHSRRIKVKITIQQEAAPGTILQQQFEVEYVVSTLQCPECAKSYTHNTWKGNVQVRQKVPHKRTFLYLEQLILKHGAHKDTINIKEVENGIDFYFAHRNQAVKFVDFLTSVAPVRTKKSQTLISFQEQNAIASYKNSYSVELVPICKDDLVALPLKLAKSIGSISPLTLCYRVGTSVNLLDPFTLQTADLATPVYWRAPFTTLADVRDLAEFIVMDIEPVPGIAPKGRFVLAEATIRRTSDLGVNDIEYTVRTHLGGILHAGDTALGYHMTGTNFNNAELEAIENSKAYRAVIPDVVLVKKVFPRRKKNKNRNWHLKRMAKEESDMAPRKQDQNRDEMDYEMFLRDVEEDEDLRNTMHLYKAQQKQKQQQQQQRQSQPKTDKMEGVQAHDDDGESDGSDDGLEIPLDQLRDEFEDMKMDDDSDGGQNDDDDDDEEEDGDHHIDHIQ